MISVCPVVTWLRSINAYTCSSSYTFADGNSPSMILQKRQSSCLISQQLLHKMYCTYQFIIKMRTSILKVLLSMCQVILGCSFTPIFSALYFCTPFRLPRYRLVSVLFRYVLKTKNLTK